ncbi:hypothetical protein T484DRAFT_1898899 [Baffinella frigidus]|nr:hypothetical protein T484DRAFT_1898899 [Cryptophyta sp. CCMP2293]
MKKKKKKKKVPPFLHGYALQSLTPLVNACVTGHADAEANCPRLDNVLLELILALELLNIEDTSIQVPHENAEIPQRFELFSDRDVSYRTVDNVLLQLILALELLNIEDTSVQAILPVFVGEILDDKFQPFLFGVIDELPDFPSVATNARAAMIMRQLGLPEQVIEKMQARSVRSIVSRVTHMQGVNATIRVVQSAPETFRFQHPMGAEVLDWLGRVSLLSYGPVMASHDLHSIGEIASLANDDLIIHKLCRTHDDMYPKRNKKDSIGDFVKLKKALGNLKGRPEGMLLAERLELFSDREVSYRTCMFSANGVETAMAKMPSIVFIILTGFVLKSHDRKSAAELYILSRNGVETAMAKIPSMVFIILTGVGAVG